MRSLLAPSAARDPRAAGLGVLLVLVLSAAAVLGAPLFMPSGYSWRSNAVSESAAQGLANGRIARSGLAAFGLAVLWLSACLRPSWARAARWMHASFGVCLVAAAVCSHRPWLPGAAGDTVEDGLHSLAATGMGFAFSLGVVARSLQRGAGPARAFDGLALVAAVATPVALVQAPSIGAVVQRGMFLVAYLWYASEARVLLAADGAARSAGGS